MFEEGAADQVADAAGFERGGGLEIFEFEEDAAGDWVSIVGRPLRWSVCTILQLWTERRTRSMGSKPKVWGGLETVDYPYLKDSNVVVGCSRVVVKSDAEVRTRQRKLST